MAFAASQQEPQPLAQGEPPVTAADAAATPRVARAHGVGFTAGLASGVGFAYRRHFANNFGVQVGGIGWGSQTASFVSLGVEVIRTVSRSDHVNFYWVAGASLFRHNGPQFDYGGCNVPADPVRPTPAPCPVETRRTTGSVNFGAGIGLEFTPGTHVGVSLELPVSLMLDLEKQNRYQRDGVYPIPGISLVYYF